MKALEPLVCVFWPNN